MTDEETKRETMVSSTLDSISFSPNTPLVKHYESDDASECVYEIIFLSLVPDRVLSVELGNFENH